MFPYVSWDKHASWPLIAWRNSFSSSQHQYRDPTTEVLLRLLKNKVVVLEGDLPCDRYKEGL